MPLHIQTNREAKQSMQRIRLGGVLSALAITSAVLGLLAFSFSQVWRIRPQESPVDMYFWCPDDLETTCCVFPAPRLPWLPENYQPKSPAEEPDIILPRVKSEFEEISCLSWEPGLEEAAQQEERMMMDDVELEGEFSSGFSMMNGGLYDLKRSIGGVFTKVAPDGKVDRAAFRKEVGKFLKTSDWGVLRPYCRSIMTLYASQFCRAAQQAVDEPYNIDTSHKISPAGRVAVYTGWVASPVTGKIRFAGFAHNRMQVSLDRKIVLDTGDHSSPDYLAYGPDIRVQSGKLYVMKVVIVEEGYATGHLLAWQLLAAEEDNLKDLNSETLYLFRTSFADEGRDIPPAFSDLVEHSSFIWRCSPLL